MPATRETDRRVAEVVGEIVPTTWYTTKAVMRATGIGHLKLAEWRSAGILKGKQVGNYVYYRGADVIAAIEREGEEV